MAACPSCLRSVPETAVSYPACGSPLLDSLTPTKHQARAGVVASAMRGLQGFTSFTKGRLVADVVLADRYRIVSQIGRGGMGEVYKAEDLKLEQTVALKFLPEAIARDHTALTRFRNEVRITRQISYPNVCRVYDIGEVDGRHFLSMEFIDGENLSSLLLLVRGTVTRDVVLINNGK